MCMKTPAELANEIREALEKAITIGPLDGLGLRIKLALDDFERSIQVSIETEAEKRSQAILGTIVDSGKKNE